jgi:hypothetical protein
MAVVEGSCWNDGRVGLQGKRYDEKGNACFFYRAGETGHLLLPPPDAHVPTECTQILK